MLRYTLQRAFMALLVAFTVSIATFILLHTATDPAQALAGPDADAQLVQQIRVQYGLDRLLAVQYADWLGGVIRGHPGVSYQYRNAVSALLASRAPVTIALALSAMMITILVAIPLGIIAAMRPNSLADRIALSLAVAAQAIPSFWLGLLLIVLFGVVFPILPVSGDTTWKHFVLPAVVLGTSSVPAVMRLTRTGLLD